MNFRNEWISAYCNPKCIHRRTNIAQTLHKHWPQWEDKHLQWIITDSQLLRLFMFRWKGFTWERVKKHQSQKNSVRGVPFGALQTRFSQEVNGNFLTEKGVVAISCQNLPSVAKSCHQLAEMLITIYIGRNAQYLKKLGWGSCKIAHHNVKSSCRS